MDKESFEQMESGKEIGHQVLELSQQLLRERGVKLIEYRTIEITGTENLEKRREAIERFNGPEDCERFFEQRGYKIRSPKPIVNESGTTLFTGAAVQILDEVIFNEG